MNNGEIDERDQVVQRRSVRRDLISPRYLPIHCSRRLFRIPAAQRRFRSRIRVCELPTLIRSDLTLGHVCRLGND